MERGNHSLLSQISSSEYMSWTKNRKIDKENDVAKQKICIYDHTHIEMNKVNESGTQQWGPQPSTHPPPIGRWDHQAKVTAGPFARPITLNFKLLNHKPNFTEIVPCAG